MIIRVGPLPSTCPTFRERGRDNLAVSRHPNPNQTRLNSLIERPMGTVTK